MSAPGVSLDDLTASDRIRLEDLIDRDGLLEMASSFYKLFSIPLRIFDSEGALLSEVVQKEPLYDYLRTFDACRAALDDVVEAVKAIDPSKTGDTSYRSITGAEYRVAGISYDGRLLGRLILGPFVPTTLRELPAALFELDAGVDVEKTRELLLAMPRAREDTVAQIARHLQRTLDVILFSGHRALLTSNMHVASVSESYRELQAKNAELQSAYDRLKELDRLKSNFLATVSHELRTPLTSVIGYSEMLVAGIAGPMSEEQTKFVQTIQEKGEQLLELIKSLLDLSKLESGTMALRRSHVDVGPVVTDVVGTLGPMANKAEVELSADVDPGLPKIWADAERVRQVVLNLTENALKFTPPGGKVRVSAETAFMKKEAADAVGLAILGSRRTAVRVTVADTGIGIPPEERLKIFDAFYQVDSGSTRMKGGTGLGLSIVKRLVEGHDGTIEVSSGSPQGTVFIVTLPCRGASVG